MNNKIQSEECKKVSIITVSYNSDKYIKTCIDSVNSQSWPFLEHVFIDGMSKDSTLSIIDNFSRREKIVISEPDKGIYDAMNKGLMHVTGDLVGILNSDDILKSPTIIENIVKKFEEHNCDAIFGDLEFVDSKNVDKIIRVWKSSSFIENSFSKGWHPPHPTLYVKREIYDKYGGFDLNLNVSADFDLMLRFFEKYKIKTKYLEQTIVKMRYGGESTGSLKKIIEGNINVMKSFKNNDIPVSIFYPFFRIFSKLPQFMKK